MQFGVMMRPFAVIMCLVAAALAGCQKSADAPANKVDLSSPAATLMTYLRAIRSGDAVTAAAATIDDTKSQQMTKLELNWISGYERLKGALKAKNLPTPGELGIDDFLVADGVAEQIDTALASPVRQVSSDDQVASVAASDGYKMSYTVRNVGGQWKIDHGESRLAALEVLRERATAYPVLADAILAGKVTTAAEAKAVYAAASK